MLTLLTFTLLVLVRTMRLRLLFLPTTRLARP
nr:MAG TPA: hypothetical protein [Caudoviricetes sp.]